jgi:hypothetical protein
VHRPSSAIHGRERIRPLLSQMIERRTAIRCDGAAGERFSLTSTPRLVLRRRGTEWKLEIAALWGWA